MRNTLRLALALPLLVAAGCDGGLGGNIHDWRNQPEPDAAAERTPTRSAGERERSKPKPRPRPAQDEPDAPAADAPPTEDPVADVRPEPPARDGGGSRGGGRGGRGGGSKGGGAAAVAVVSAGAEGDAPGRLSGTVLFDGSPPPRAPLTTIASTEGCHAHESTPLSEDAIVVDGKLQNVFVTIRKVPAGVTVPPPSDEPLTLDQLGCMYVPHVSGIQAGRTLLASNSDGTSHNVRVSASKNDAPNRTVGAGGAPLEVLFDAAENVKFACDIHPWMSAYVCVVEHPWYAVSGPDGTWSIEDLPAGEWELEAWHEKFGKIKSDTFTLGAGGEVQVEFTYQP